MKRPTLYTGVLITALALAACGGGGGGGGGGNIPASPGTLQFLETSFDATEGTVVNIFVARSGGSSGVVSVDYATADGTGTAGSDYVAGSGTLNLPAGTTSQLFSIEVNGDTAYENNEDFLVNLTNPTNATISDHYDLECIIW